MSSPVTVVKSPLLASDENRSRGTALPAGLVAKVLTVAGVLALWQVLAAAGVLAPDRFPAPTSIGAAGAKMVAEGPLWRSFGLTLLGWSLGLLLSVAIAIPVGLALGLSDFGYRSCRFTIDFLRTIPPVALVPLALLLYGATTEMKLVLVVLGSVWPLLLQTMYGVHQIDPTARETARSYRLDRRRRILFLVLPGASPLIATGVRISATMALLLTIGAELIGSADGLGNAIGLAQTAGDVPRMFALIVVSAVLGVVTNALLLSAERRALSWHVSHRPSHAR
jgi:ABC-type nitrate/sulfonate/bicarbonate transport system permease component